MILAQSLRENLEAELTFRRIVELELKPVAGDFSSGHLCEINRRIFQDLPGYGFDDAMPGKYRPEVPEGKTWLKQRKLKTKAGTFFVAYSRMDATAQHKINVLLNAIKPDQLRQLDITAATLSLATLYAELDHIHPFSDGNSRTLRTYTRQLAREAGFDLDWRSFNDSSTARDGLYIARDQAVNRLTLPTITNESTMRRIIASMAALKDYPDLLSLLKGTVRRLS